MVGTNVMHLNEATMIQAVQEWLSSRLEDKSSIKVVSVKAGGNDIFSVTIEAKP